MTAPTEWEDGYEQGWKDARKQYVALGEARLAAFYHETRQGEPCAHPGDETTPECVVFAAEYARLSGVPS